MLSLFKKKAIILASILKKKSQKEMLVLATFIFVIIATKKAGKNSEYPEINLAQVLYIWYYIIYQKKSMLVLLNLKNEVNAIYLTFAKKLGLFI